jgi:hypothetical protein
MTVATDASYTTHWHLTRYHAVEGLLSHPRSAVPPSLRVRDAMSESRHPIMRGSVAGGASSKRRSWMLTPARDSKHTGLGPWWRSTPNDGSGSALGWQRKHRSSLAVAVLGPVRISYPWGSIVNKRCHSLNTTSSRSTASVR